MLDRIQRSADLSSIANYARSSPVRGGGGGLSAAETYQINQLDAVRKIGALGMSSASSDVGAQWLSKRFGSSSDVKISAAARMQSGLSEFKDKLQELIQTSNPLKVQSSQPELVDAKPIQGGQLQSVLSLEVKQLAQSQQIQTRSFSPAEAQIGTGKLLIQRASLVGGQYPIDQPVTINITEQNNSLAGIAKAINDSGATIRAEVVRDSLGSRLELTGKATGQEQGFLITALDNDGNDADDAGLSALNFDPSNGQVANRVAQDANLKIDARNVSSADNLFEDKASNLQLQLLATGNATLTISRDAEALTKNFSGLIKYYNQARDVLLGIGGAAANTVLRQLSDSVANRSVSRGVTQLDSTGIGLNLGASGKLFLNEMRLNQQAQVQPESVNELFNLMAEELKAQVSGTMNEQNSFANALRDLRGTTGLAINPSVSSSLLSPSANFSLPLNSRALVGVMQYVAIARYQ